MDNSEDEDDTHFCNKCHATINGLDNYVRHRQSRCRTSGEDKTEVYDCPASASTAVSYPEILNADAFFSSLELQSSAKQSHQRQLSDQLNTQPRRSGRNLDRKRKQRKDKSPDDKDESKDKLPTLIPDDAELDVLGLASLGFPELVASTSSLNKPSTSKGKLITGEKVKNDQLDCKRQHDDHQDQSVWLEDIFTGPEDDNKPDNKSDINEEHSGRYEDYDYPHDEESEAESLDSDDDESDSYSDSEDQDNQDPDFPPRSHTGGKWRPDGPSHEEINAPEDEDDEVEHQHEHPPPTYTGGKWKPPTAETVTQQQKSEENGSKEASKSQQQQQQSPPPSHTRGKWVPGAQADIATGYWCSPCGRRLASRLVYERHLLSDLHARRSIQEIDGAVQIPRCTVNDATSLFHGENLSRRQKVLALKKRGESLDRSSPPPTPPKKHRTTTTPTKNKKQQRHREKEILTCEMCRARVRRGQMGKHLLSHYHCRVAGVQPSSLRAQRFLLENMANVVRQCPFQCASCRFYCNTENTFLRHWRSDAHKDTVSKIEGRFVCASCDFWCDDNESMEGHMMEQGHRDVVSMVNGSVPIVIRRQRILYCSTCCRQFRYNIQLRTHAKETGHKMSYSASDVYQVRLSCDICGQISRSLIALQRHKLASHKSENAAEATIPQAAKVTSVYFCSFCSLTFNTSKEAVIHRRTLSHKEAVKNKKSNEEATPQVCAYCDEVHISLAEYKPHLLKKHPEACYSCPKCGERFAFSQDVTRHTRENRCKPCGDSSVKQWKCTECQSFASESKSEYLFHKILHAGPEQRRDDNGHNNNKTPKYRCSVCSQTFTKKTLRDHLRRHTGEKPFPCGKCNTRFMRRSSANTHQRRCKGTVRAGLEELERKYTCYDCGAAFSKKYIIRQHMLRHYGKQYKCGLPGCPTILRTETELKRHRKLVHESSDMIFQCDDCSYSTKTKVNLIRHRKQHDKEEGSTTQRKCPFPGCKFKTDNKSHMRRHVRIHTNHKPYKCRHCDYASNNVENLRKHVLSSARHPGMMIYECKSCKGHYRYQTNYEKDLRAHLLADHPEEYPTPNHARAYVSNIFK